MFVDSIRALLHADAGRHLIELADREQYLTRKIANLLDLEPGCLAQAKAAAGRKD